MITLLVYYIGIRFLAALLKNGYSDQYQHS